METREQRHEMGFTLLELLTVMAIVLILMTMSLAAYHGLTRGASVDGAVLNLRSSMALARQFAVTHRCKVFVRFKQDGTNSSYLVCASEGWHEGADGVPNKLTLGYNNHWVPGAMVGSIVYNLTDGSYGIITENTDMTLTAVLSNGTQNVWNKGHRYGWSIRDVVDLPDGVMFGDGQPSSTPEAVVFNIDGTTEKSASGDYRMEVREKYAVTPMSKTVVVRGLTGMISVE